MGKSVKAIRKKVLKKGVGSLCLSKPNSNRKCTKTLKKIVDKYFTPRKFNIGERYFVISYYRTLANHIFLPVFSRVESLCKKEAGFNRRFTSAVKLKYLKCTSQYLAGSRTLYKDLKGTNITLPKHFAGLYSGLLCLVGAIHCNTCAVNDGFYGIPWRP